MEGDIDSVNHVGLVVRDLDAACSFYEDLGFILSPLSMHKGSLKPGEPEVPYGSGNRCAVFSNNYLEIVAHVVKDRFDFYINDFLDRFEGAHIIAFGCGDATVVHDRLAGAGIDSSGVIPLERDLETPEGMRTAKFDCIHFPKSDTREGLIQAAHHRTPEYIHQPRYLTHPNRTVALCEVVVCADDPDGIEHRYRQILGREATREGPKRVFTFPLVSKLSIVAADDLVDVVPGCVPPAVPFIAASTMATEDMGAVERCIDSNGLTHAKLEGKIVVPAEVAFGHTLVFEAV